MGGFDDLGGSRARYNLGAPGSLAKTAVSGLVRRGFLRKLWAKDASLWKNTPEHAAIIENSLGWLVVPGLMKVKADELTAFAEEARSAGFTDAVLLGMGGSSLAPLVYKDILGVRHGFLRLHVLDSTDPAAIRRVEKSVNAAKTLFIVASKSGTTIEPNCLYEYFLDKVKNVKGKGAGSNFVAITDPGTVLESLARKAGFRKTFVNRSDIGGRYSALSYFGLVPAALIGVDIKKFLSSALQMLSECSPGVKEVFSPGAVLGGALGGLAKAGRNKVTFFLAPELESFSLWLEQLIAESTGKERKGIVPVSGEPRVTEAAYSSDRVFVTIGLKGKKEPGAAASLIKRRQPVVSITLDDAYDIAGEMVRWEVATAAAGSILGINPFDQPDVEDAKKRARAVLGDFEKNKASGIPYRMILDDKDMAVYINKPGQRITGVGRKPKDALKKIFTSLKKGSYLALLPYLDMDDAALKGPLDAVRKAVLLKTKKTTLFGFGPRYLHSTGQLHKGGPRGGAFFFMISDGGVDASIPGKAYSFASLERAQLLGDMDALGAKGKAAALFVLKGKVAVSLESAAALIKAALK
ncbi:MAG: glucose-6-phosphate isomerase [Deltaproteobacteria bacterium]|nr:glucose-6-phosphate isomerase [Deltaproteobacteria bacterium]